MVRLLGRMPLAIALATAALAAACGGASSSPATPSKPFVIGAVLPFSGIYGVVGPSAQQGMQTAINQINASGGILGRQVKFVVRDDGSDPNKAVLAAHDLIDNEKVDFMFPESAGPVTLAVLPVTTQARMITLEPGSGDTNHPDKYPYNFGWSQPKAVDVAAIAAAIKQTLPNVKKIATLTTNDIPGQNFADAVKKQMPGIGVNVTGTELFSAGTADLTVQLQRVRQGGADALAVHATGKDVTTIGNGIRDLGWKDVTVIGDGGALPLADLNQQIPAAIQSQVIFPIFRGASRDGETADSPFIKELLKVGTIQNLYVSELDGDAMKMVRWAFNKAGSTDPDKVKGVLEGVGKLSAKDLPQDLVLYSGMNPGYSSTDHSIAGADLSRAFALGKISPLVNGTYQRTALLTVPKVTS
jgi:branched-chain amino acid transport system substrate-binding protein